MLTTQYIMGLASGVVSVIDVAHGVLLWSLPHLQLPVISARVGLVQLPSRRER